MAPVTLYTTKFCPFCVRAKMLLDKKKVTYKEIRVDNNNALRAEMTKKSGLHTVPQIWINHQHIGGCDELHDLQRKGLLDELLQV